jgi:hypothetical protein
MAAAVKLAAQRQLECLDKRFNGRAFITGPRCRIAGITTQPGVGFGTQAAGLEPDLALVNVFGIAQLKCRAARARRRDLSLPPDEQAGSPKSTSPCGLTV